MCGPEDARGGPVLVYFMILGWTLTKKQLGELKFYVIFPVQWQSIPVIHGRNLEPRIKAETLNENFPLANSLWFAQHNFNSEVSLLRDGLVTAGWAGLHQSAVRTVLQTLATQAILVFVELMEIIQPRTPDVRCNLSCSGPQQTGSSGPWNDHKGEFHVCSGVGLRLRDKQRVLQVTELEKWDCENPLEPRRLGLLLVFRQ